MIGAQWKLLSEEQKQEWGVENAEKVEEERQKSILRIESSKEAKVEVKQGKTTRAKSTKPLSEKKKLWTAFFTAGMKDAMVKAQEPNPKLRPAIIAKLWKAMGEEKRAWGEVKAVVEEEAVEEDVEAVEEEVEEEEVVEEN